jgi:hypothetical protein
MTAIVRDPDLSMPSPAMTFQVPVQPRSAAAPRPRRSPLSVPALAWLAGLQLGIVAADQVRWTSGLDGKVVAPATAAADETDDAAVSGQVHRVL